MLGVPSKTPRDPPLVKGATLLEMLWIGAQTSSLRKRLRATGYPSPVELRSRGMVHVNLMKDREMQGTGKPEETSLLNPGFSTFEFEDVMQGIVRVFSTLVDIASSL